MNKQEKKELLLKLYGFDEICEIMGVFDGSNEDVCTPEILSMDNESKEFEDLILEQAIINGNFEEVLEHGVRFPI